MCYIEINKINMKPLALLVPVAAILLSATTPLALKKPSDENWYICSHCCKTKKASSAPWLSGCRVSSSGTHNFQFAGKAADFNYTCRKCDAEMYLSSSQSPAASRCCATGGTHSWYHAK